MTIIAILIVIARRTLHCAFALSTHLLSYLLSYSTGCNIGTGTVIINISRSRRDRTIAINSGSSIEVLWKGFHSHQKKSNAKSQFEHSHDSDGVSQMIVPNFYSEQGEVF